MYLKIKAWITCIQLLQKEEKQKVVWGIEDEYLFELVNETIDPSSFSFNILTTSYHPPYSVDVIKKGFQSTLTIYQKHS